MSSFDEKVPSWLKIASRLAPILTLIGTIWIWHALNVNETRHRSQLSDTVASNAAGEIAARLNAPATALWRMAQSRVDIGEDRTRWKFDADFLLRRTPGLFAVNFVDNDLTIREVAQSTETYVLGRNLRPDPTRLKAFALARNTGQPVATPAITLFAPRDQGKRLGFLLIVPLSRKGRPAGFVTGVFGASEVFENTLRFVEPNYSVVVTSNGEEMYRRGLAASDRTATASHPVAIPGCGWRVETWPSEGGIPQRAFSDDILLIAGIALSMFIGLSVRLTEKVRARAGDLQVANSDLLQEILRRAEVEAALQRSTEELETRVAERTAELQSSNCSLRREVAERERAEEALRESERRLALLIAQSPLAVIEWDMKLRVTGWNPTAEQVFGYAATEAIGRSADDLFGPNGAEESFDRYWRHLLETRGTRNQRRRSTQTKDGRSIQCEWYDRVLVNGEADAVGVVSIVHDVSQQVELEEQFRHAQKMEAVGRLSGGVAHDFNNLLNVILGYGELLLRDLGQQERYRKRLDPIMHAALRAADLTRQLLAFSRKQVLEPKILSCNAVILDAEKMLRRLIGEDIDLQTILTSEDPMVKADPGQLEQVIMNLAVNARDAMPNGGMLTIETALVQIDGSYSRRHFNVPCGPYVMIAVSDTGTGMDDATKARIFEPFFTTKPKDKGTGLGLSTVYGIVQQSGGCVQVYSELNRGTTFKTYLPLVRFDSAQTSFQQQTDNLQLGSGAVLIVEDDAELRAFAGECLRAQGFSVHEAANGAEALSSPGLSGVDLLITDVIMPGMNGKELSDRLSKLRPEIKVLYTSGYTDNGIVHQGLLDKGLAFLQKPYSASELVTRASRLLAPSREATPSDSTGSGAVSETVS